MNKIFFILFLVQFSYGQAQEPWLYENSFYYAFQILESYDEGTIILATAESQTDGPKILKLDKMGEVLWIHTFEEDVSTLPLCMGETSNGDIVIGGRTHRYEEMGDGFLMKLNACGELIWFKKIGYEGEMDTVTHLILDEEGYINLIHYLPATGDNFTLKSVNSNGTILWSKVLLEGGGGSPEGFSTTKDGGFLVHGSYYAPPTIIKSLAQVI
jgi:hypothetical protein